MELETIQEIAHYHRVRAQGGEGGVALCAHKVAYYNDTAKKCGVDLTFDREKKIWTFADRGKSCAAYMHHPRHDILKSPSHCGVEFSRALRTQYVQAKFARRMCNQRFHIK